MSMVILAAKSTDANFEDVKRGGFSCVGAGQGWRSSSWRSSRWRAEDSSLLSLSLVALSANLIVALIISVFGFHFSKGPSF